MTRRFGIYVWALLAFAASELLATSLGVRFASETLGILYQYLDSEILRNDLAMGLYHLHSQPPLFNLGIGWVLKLFPGGYESAFSLLMGAAALALVMSMTWLMRRLEVPDRVNALVVLGFALAPNFLVYRHWLFYTLPVALLLVIGAVFLLLYMERGSRWALWSFAGTATAVMLTRSLYHPLWFVLVVAAVVPFAPAGRRRALLIAALVPLFVVNLWFLKNQALVGSYSASSWLGLSLAKRWPLTQAEVKELKASGALPPYWHRRPFREPDELAEFGFFADRSGADENETHPALDEPYKANDEPNFNHRDYVEISNGMMSGNLTLIRSYPDRYLRRVGTAFLLYLQPGPNSVHFLVDYDFEGVHRYRDFLTRYLFLGDRVERPIQMLEPEPNLFVFVFALLVVFGVLRLRTGPPEWRCLDAYMLVSVLWVTGVANFIEIGENDRMRWEIEPFLAIWLGCLLSSLVRGFRARRERGRVRISEAAGTA
jgi:Ca2+/Na+ antiporter